MNATFLKTALAIVLWGTTPAAASLITAVQTVTVTNGSTGNSLEVSLFNNGAAVVIDSFSVGLDVAGTDIIFQSATTATAVHPYIFIGNSFFGPVISTSSPGQNLTASDIWGGAGNGVTLGTGVTVALGQVFFDASAGATGSYTVSFDPLATSLADINGTPITINTETPGSIIIAMSSVPEPSTLILMSLAAAVSLVWARKERSQA
jgi:hypothetical protein